MKLKNSIRIAGSHGASSPLTLIIVTVAMLVITTECALASFTAFRSIEGDTGMNAMTTLAELHSAIEALYNAPPGSSITVYAHFQSGNIIFAQNSLFSNGLNLLELPDPSGIVISSSEGRVTYNSSLVAISSAAVPSGSIKIILSAEVSSIIKEILIEVNRI